ncbi:hypothetical protein L249_4468 [Ophiocordyceps polyrhachis-furcata BCC 54312]|uniref:Uncharacterized protein n=1 Tax=Ophiocordyceps polyrhachis-furcata BCC 54312 TaxID=1330021 RepID=A0A367L879_9HYPO|nr:hypothetical protein L249_4468 [Ophiocordyceps polyrhachis-furcata BCC 54312]
MRYFVGRWRKRKAVKMEMMMSNQGVDYVIEKKKTNHVIYSASIAYSAPIDVQRADRCDDRCNESIRAL